MCSVCNTAHNIISAVWFPCKSLPHSSDYRTLSSNSDKELTTTTKYIYNNVKCKLINENYLISSVRCVCFCVCDVVVTAIAAVAAAAYGWIVISLPFSVVRARRETGEWSPLTFNFACDPSFVDMYLFCLLLACRPFPHSSQISFSWLCYLLLCGCSSHTAHPMTNLLTSTLDIAVYFGRILSFFFCFVNLLWENDRRKKNMLGCWMEGMTAEKMRILDRVQSLGCDLALLAMISSSQGKYTEAARVRAQTRDDKQFVPRFGGY